MGAKFQFEHANFIAYLTAASSDAAPHADKMDLETFLVSLTNPNSLVSPTRQRPSDWAAAINKVASAQVARIRDLPLCLLDPKQVGSYLDPLRSYFTGYDLYCLVIPASDNDEESFNFFIESSTNSRDRGLILIPERCMNFVEFLNPFPEVREIAASLPSPPCVLFWTKNERCILPLEEAKRLYRQQLVQCLETSPQAVTNVLRRAKKNSQPKRILHLSDLHLGKKEADASRSWLKTHLFDVLPSIDATVITGDLFDNPQVEHRLAFAELKTDLERMTEGEVIIIPGNHDSRKDGNAFGSWRRDGGQVAQLNWAPLVVDEKLRIAFYCFDSNEEGDFARGNVPAHQRLDRATKFDEAVRRSPELSGYFKVALVHHHPFKYGTQPAELYEKFITKLFRNDDVFIEFENANDFMTWCANRGVSLVLHGHKHVPHFRRASIGKQRITVVGCGSSTGAGRRPMCYDILTIDPFAKSCSVEFFECTNSDGGSFESKSIGIDLRSASSTNTRPSSGVATGRAPTSVAYSPNRATDDDERILKAILGARKEEIDL